MDGSKRRQHTGHHDIPETLTGWVELTERDLEILLLLHENVFAHTGHFKALHGERIDERLRKLRYHGYIATPRSQRAWRRIEGGGSRPLVYARTEKGEKALLAHGMIVRSRGDWAKPNRKRSRYAPSLEHHLAVAEVRVMFHLACAKRGWRIIPIAELAGVREVHGLAIPRRGKRYPDWSFAIDAGRDLSSLFFTEVDRSHEPNSRAEREFDEEAEDWDIAAAISEVRPKYVDYRAYALAGSHARQFNVPGFRVLTISAGRERKVANLASTAASVCEGVGLSQFLATNFDALALADPFDAPWIDAAGSLVNLAP